MFAMVADALEGPWTRVENDDNDFIGIPGYLFNKDGSKTAYDQISHPELIRSGFDERLEIKDYRRVSSTDDIGSPIFTGQT